MGYLQKGNITNISDQKLRVGTTQQELEIFDRGMQPDHGNLEGKGEKQWLIPRVALLCLLGSGLATSFHLWNSNKKQRTKEKEKTTTIDWVHKRQTSKQKASWISRILGKGELFNTSWNID